jgi:hypothetical protein
MTPRRAGDFKFRHTGPASPTLVRIEREWILPGTAAWVPGVDTAFSAADIALAGTGTIGGVIYFEGIIHNGPNAGTFGFIRAEHGDCRHRRNSPGRLLHRIGGDLGEHPAEQRPRTDRAHGPDWRDRGDRTHRSCWRDGSDGTNRHGRERRRGWRNRADRADRADRGHRSNRSDGTDRADHDHAHDQGRPARLRRRECPGGGRPQYRFPDGGLGASRRA